MYNFPASWPRQFSDTLNFEAVLVTWQINIRYHLWTCMSTDLYMLLSIFYKYIIRYIYYEALISRQLKIYDDLIIVSHILFDEFRLIVQNVFLLFSISSRLPERKRKNIGIAFYAKISKINPPTFFTLISLCITFLKIITNDERSREKKLFLTYRER